MAAGTDEGPPLDPALGPLGGPELEQLLEGALARQGEAEEAVGAAWRAALLEASRGAPDPGPAADADGGAPRDWNGEWQLLCEVRPPTGNAAGAARRAELLSDFASEFAEAAQAVALRAAGTGSAAEGGLLGFDCSAAPAAAGRIVRHCSAGASLARHDAALSLCTPLCASFCSGGRTVLVAARLPLPQAPSAAAAASPEVACSAAALQAALGLREPLDLRAGESVAGGSDGRLYWLPGTRLLPDSVGGAPLRPELAAALAVGAAPDPAEAAPRAAAEAVPDCAAALVAQTPDAAPGAVSAECHCRGLPLRYALGAVHAHLSSAADEAARDAVAAEAARDAVAAEALARTIKQLAREEAAAGAPGAAGPRLNRLLHAALYDEEGAERALALAARKFPGGGPYRVPPELRGAVCERACALLGLGWGAGGAAEEPPLATLRQVCSAALPSLVDSAVAAGAGEDVIAVLRARPAASPSMAAFANMQLGVVMECAEDCGPGDLALCYGEAMSAARDSGDLMLLSAAQEHTACWRLSAGSADIAAGLLDEAAASRAKAVGPAGERCTADAVGLAKLLARRARHLAAAEGGYADFKAHTTPGLEEAVAELDALAAAGAISRSQCSYVLLPLLQLLLCSEREADDLAAAEVWARRQFELAAAARGPNHEETALAWHDLGRCLAALGRLPEAAEALQAAAGAYRAQTRESQVGAARATRDLARVYLRQAREADPRGGEREEGEEPPPDEAMALYEGARLMFHQLVVLPTAALSESEYDVDASGAVSPRAAGLRREAYDGLAEVSRCLGRPGEQGMAGAPVPEAATLVLGDPKTRRQRRDAAGLLQRCGRGMSGRRAAGRSRRPPLQQQQQQQREAKAAREEEESAATKIQALQRGRQARRKSLDRRMQRAQEQERRALDASEAERSHAAVQIQKARRGSLGRQQAKQRKQPAPRKQGAASPGEQRRAKVRRQKEEDAAVRIQSLQRGRQGRRCSEDAKQLKIADRNRRASEVALPGGVSPASSDLAEEDDVAARNRRASCVPLPGGATPAGSDIAPGDEPTPLRAGRSADPDRAGPAATPDPELSRWREGDSALTAPAGGALTPAAGGTHRGALQHRSRTPAARRRPLPDLPWASAASCSSALRGARGHAAHVGKKQALDDMQWWANKTRLLRQRLERARRQEDREDAAVFRREQARQQHESMQAELAERRAQQNDELLQQRDHAGAAREERRVSLRTARQRLIAWKAEGRERVLAVSAVHNDAIRAARVYERSAHSQTRDGIRSQRTLAARARLERQERLRVEAVKRFEEKLVSEINEQQAHEQETLRLIQGSAELLRELQSMRQSRVARPPQGGGGKPPAQPPPAQPPQD